MPVWTVHGAAAVYRHSQAPNGGGRWWPARALYDDPKTRIMAWSPNLDQRGDGGAAGGGGTDMPAPPARKTSDSYLRLRLIGINPVAAASAGPDRPS